MAKATQPASDGGGTAWPKLDAVDSIPIDIFNTLLLPATIPVVEKAIAARGSKKCVLVFPQFSPSLLGNSRPVHVRGLGEKGEVGSLLLLLLMKTGAAGED